MVLLQIILDPVTNFPSYFITNNVHFLFMFQKIVTTRKMVFEKLARRKRKNTVKSQLNHQGVLKNKSISKGGVQQEGVYN